MGQVEKQRGDKWADKLRRRGCWVEKLSPPPTGLPDWLVASVRGNRMVEAKTLEAVLDAEECRPWCACSGAQQFMLRMLHEHGGPVSVLVLGPNGYVECDYGASLAPMSAELFAHLEVSYDG